jgi:hypothetical protein
LANFNVQPSVEQAWNRLQDFAALNDAVPIDIRSIHRWYQEEWNTEHFDTPEKRRRFWKNAADIKPSFDSAWFEWRPNCFYAEDGRQTKVDGRAVWALDLPPFMPGWTMVLFERHDGHVMVTHVWSLDGNRTNESQIGLNIPPGDPTDTEHCGFLCDVMIPVILAQNLMHCRNVVIEEQPTPSKMADRFKRKHKLRPIKWRAVVIEPMKTVFKRCGGVQEVGVVRAMHMVRGNFAEYTEEKPMFGKVVGRVFRAMHVRGDKTVGIKKPGYTIEAPNK